MLVLPADAVSTDGVKEYSVPVTLSTTAAAGGELMLIFGFMLVVGPAW
jgi:hypothetical protein